MLKKLLKYEFKATGRTFGGLYLGLAVAAVMLGIVIRIALPGEAMFNATTIPTNTGVGILSVLLVLVYFALLVATIVLTFVTIIDRFEKNLLGGEGYLMHTLPVGAKSLIAGKLIVSAVWGIASFLVITVSAFVMMSIAMMGTPAFSTNMNLADLLMAAQQEFGMPLPVMLLGLLIAGIAVTASGVLMIYAACMIGHQVKKYKMPVSILAFFGLASAQSMLEGLLGFGGGKLVEVNATASSIGGSFTAALNALPTAGQFWLDVAVTVLPAAVFAVIYFFLTDWLMEKHLNLE